MRSSPGVMFRARPVEVLKTCCNNCLAPASFCDLCGKGFIRTIVCFSGVSLPRHFCGASCFRKATGGRR